MVQRPNDPKRKSDGWTAGTSTVRERKRKRNVRPQTMGRIQTTGRVQATGRVQTALRVLTTGRVYATGRAEQQRPGDAEACQST